MSDTDIALRTDDSPAEKDLEGTFPDILVRAGKAACFAADEFFSARISNPHTRTAYAHQVSRFLAWCEDQGLELHQVTPGLAGRFLDELPGAAPTQNQALAGLRHFFDTLVARHAAVLNPFQSVRGVGVGGARACESHLFWERGSGLLPSRWFPHPARDGYL